MEKCLLLNLPRKANLLSAQGVPSNFEFVRGKAGDMDHSSDGVNILKWGVMTSWIDRHRLSACNAIKTFCKGHPFRTLDRVRNKRLGSRNKRMIRHY